MDMVLALPVFALILFRVTGLMLTAPVLASRAVPLRIRAAFALVMAAMLVPMVSGQTPIDASLASVVGGGIRELAVGVGIGLSLSILVALAEVTGVLVSQQAGIAIANVIDPARGDEVSVISQVYVTCLTLVFLSMGGLRAAVAALLDTFTVIPLWSQREVGSTVLLLVNLLGASFVVGIRLAGPVVIALFLSGIGLGVLSRTMPQLNILTVGFTFRALIGLGVAGLALSLSEEVMVGAIVDMVETIRAAFGLDAANTRLVT